MIIYAINTKYDNPLAFMQSPESHSFLNKYIIDLNKLDGIALVASYFTTLNVYLIP